jgi:ATP-binding protein involved in chromosome partitioning
MVVVTTPQEAAQKVALRAGRATEQTGMSVAGVIENMAGFTCPDCGSTHELFGSGGGAALAEELGTELLGRIPIDPRLREASDIGIPLVASDPDVPAAQAIRRVAEQLAAKARSVVGRKLPLSVS